MKLTVLGLAVVVLATAILLGIFGIIEGFGSPGTYVQLDTSHVPNERDAYYYNTVYPKLLRKEITDMTGEDPGDIPTFLSPYSGTYYLW